MIVVVETASRPQFARQVDQMYCLRHRGSLGRVGWQPACQDFPPNIDEFDIQDAIYLLDLDESGRVLAGLRLLPTTGPHLIAQRFSAEILNGKMPIGKQVYELSHYFASGQGTAGSTCRHLWKIFAAMFDFCQGRGITHVSTVCDIQFVPSLLDLGWETLPLGVPFESEDIVCVPLIVEVAGSALATKHALARECVSVN